MAEAGAGSVLPVGSLFPVEGEGEEVRLLWGTTVRTESLGVSVRLMALSLSEGNHQGVSLPQQDGGSVQHMHNLLSCPRSQSLGRGPQETVSKFDTSRDTFT